MSSLLDRRRFLASAAALALASRPASADEPASSERRRAETILADIRGSIDAGERGLRAGAVDDQSRTLQALLDEAAGAGRPVFLPPGTYVVSNLKLPARARLIGIPSASRLVYGGRGHLVLAENSEVVGLDGLVLDGGNRPLMDYAGGLVTCRDARELTVSGCTILGSSRAGLWLERCAGRVERTAISGAMSVGLLSRDARGLAIRDNVMEECGDGGILVHRSALGEDGTIVTANRVERIHARSGGTGQHGNGINVFRAGGVIVANNRVADCAFSAIRSNSGSNVQILGNQCLRSGETGLYAEFVFEGAVVSGNVVDGAAHGISVVNFDQGGRLATVVGNIVRNMRTTGPYDPGQSRFGSAINVEADTVVTGNIVENAPLYGVNVGWGPYLRDVIVSSNVIREAGAGIGVTVVEGARTAMIVDNLIRGAKRGGIVGHRWKDIVTGDLALGGAERFPHLVIERNRVG